MCLFHLHGWLLYLRHTGTVAFFISKHFIKYFKKGKYSVCPGWTNEHINSCTHVPKTANLQLTATVFQQLCWQCFCVLSAIQNIFRSVLTSLCLCGWMRVCMYIITLSINSCKMYLLDSFYKQQKLLNTNELRAEHRTGCVPTKNEESQLRGICNLAFMLLLLKCKNKVTIYFSFKGLFRFLYNFVL